MKSINYKLFNLAFVCTMLMYMGPVTQSSAQVVLYMEMMSEEKPIKYYEGQMLSFKSADYPDEWQTIKIDRLIDDEKLVLYDGGIMKLSDIIEVRRTRGWANTMGYMLQTFGVAWFGFGGIAHFTTSNFSFGVDTLAIGATAIASGWIIRKFLKHKKYKVGRRNRLKILDLSWPEPTGSRSSG
ncbi:MAG: hypothetical protein ACI86M_003045 [Saprospiraceae bacterium]|jgi:hypothetical protein